MPDTYHTAGIRRGPPPQLLRDPGQPPVVASSRFDEEPNPFDPSCSEHVYWELLHELAAKDGVQPRVVVDVISGTSAGGINGVFLAKAIAHDLSQQSLRDLWFNEADIGKLLAGPRWLNPLGAKGKLAWFALRALLARGRVAPPLRGDQMCRLLYGALSAMTPVPCRRPPRPMGPTGRACCLGRGRWSCS